MKLRLNAVEGCYMKTIWSVLLILASLAAAILFPRWWVGVIVIMVVCQAYGQLPRRKKQTTYISA